MDWKEKIIKEYGLGFHVKDILIFEGFDIARSTVIPFFADGYPGVMFQQTNNGVFLRPQNKYLSDLFLYGQTIHPIELCVEGAYRFIVFQLQPIAAKPCWVLIPKN